MLTEFGIMKLHFVGIGGIGMSALAAMALDLGHRVSGSDRGADRPENARIIDALKRSVDFWRDFIEE